MDRPCENPKEKLQLLYLEVVNFVNIRESVHIETPWAVIYYM